MTKQPTEAETETESESETTHGIGIGSTASAGLPTSPTAPSQPLLRLLISSPLLLPGPNPSIQPPPTPCPWPCPAATSSSPSVCAPLRVEGDRHHQSRKVFPWNSHPAPTLGGIDGGSSSSSSNSTRITSPVLATTGCRRRRRLVCRVMDYVAARVTAHAHHVAHPPPPLHLQTTNRMHSQRRVDLEQEVAELKQQLSNEQTVHDILERALQPTSARSIVLNIPAFIPTKAKELLAELVLVEEEIARLEDQIRRMKGGLSAMQQQRAKATSDSSNAAAAANGRANGTTHAPLHQRQPPDDGKVAPETIKSMFFISQAMNGEYLKRHLGDDKARSPKETSSMRRGAAMSPKYDIFGLPPRSSFDKQSDRPVEKPPKIFQEPTAMKSPTKRDDQKIQPNKLSERIVKCLVCIFIRLLRSSRVAEMEKSGNLARSGNLQGSFRIDTGLNVAASVAKDKQRGQQDHYGIFGIQDSIVRDIGPYKNLVRFTSSSFDLRGFSSSPLLTKLREMLEALQQVDLKYLTHQQKLAFWLNIYNTCIMHGILQHGLPSNSEKLLALKNKATINVSGQMFNALVIENFILRQPSSVKEEFWKCDVDVEEQEVRGLYGLNSSEPNILFALCCGIRSSPALRIYKPDRVMMDLEKAKLDYLQASLVVTSTRKLMIPSLMHSNMHDFAKDMESLVRWICDQLPTSWSLRKSMVDRMRGQSHLKVEEVVDVIPYDYEFQYLLPM